MERTPQCAHVCTPVLALSIPLLLFPPLPGCCMLWPAVLGRTGMAPGTEKRGFSGSLASCMVSGAALGCQVAVRLGLHKVGEQERERSVV